MKWLVKKRSAWAVRPWRRLLSTTAPACQTKAASTSTRTSSGCAAIGCAARSALLSPRVRRLLGGRSPPPTIRVRSDRSSSIDRLRRRYGAWPRSFEALSRLLIVGLADGGFSQYS